jgi:hypothetical protein
MNYSLTKQPFGERKIRQRHYLEKAPRRKFFRGTRVKKDEIISA